MKHWREEEEDSQPRLPICVNAHDITTTLPRRSVPPVVASRPVAGGDTSSLAAHTAAEASDPPHTAASPLPGRRAGTPAVDVPEAGAPP